MTSEAAVAAAPPSGLDLRCSGDFDLIGSASHFLGLVKEAWGSEFQALSSIQVEVTAAVGPLQPVWAAA